MKLQKIGILAITFLTLNSQAMEKLCTSIDDLRNDGTSFYSWLPAELRKEVCKFAMNDKKHHALRWALHKHAESVDFGAKRLEGHNDMVQCVAVANNRIISGLDNGNIKIWNPEKELCEKTLLGHTDWIRCLAVANKKIISGSNDTTIKIWNPETGECETTLRGHGNAVSCLAVTSKNIISGSNDRTIKIWNIETEQCEKILQGHTAWIYCLAVANKKIISGSHDRTIKIWNPESGECVKTLHGHTSWITCLAVANNRIISGSGDGMIEIWDLEKELDAKTLEGHTYTIRCFALANNRLISGSGDRTIKIWDLEKENCCYSLNVSGVFLEHIDVAAGYAYSIQGSNIIILKLEDSAIKDALESSMDATNLMESAYECSQKNKALDLRTDACFHNTFIRLPIALQKVIQKEITVHVPTQSSGYISSLAKYILG